MAKKKFTIEDLKSATRNQENSANNKGPVHIPNQPLKSKTPHQTTVKIYKEDLIELKSILLQRHAENLAKGIDKKLSMEDLFEEMVDLLKEKQRTLTKS